MKPIKHKIIQVSEKIFALEIPNDFDRAMTFLRCQEYYESSSPKFKGKDFDIWEYLRWYSTERSSIRNSFTYASDWAGFNVPIKVIVECMDKQKTQTTPYDEFMDEVLHQIFNKYEASENDTYLIGVDSINNLYFEHEMSHAMWYTNPEYKKEMTRIVKEGFGPELITEASDKLSKMGYAKKVHMDEIVAYSSTGDIARLIKSKDCSSLELVMKANFQIFLSRATSLNKLRNAA